MKLEIGQTAPDARVVDIHGDVVKISSLWKSKPVLFYFHRHLGCVFAKQTFKRLDCSIGQLETFGIQVVSIVPTTSANTSGFCTEGDYWHTCLADPSLSSYKAYGVTKANPIQIFGPGPMSAAFQAIKRGYRQSCRLVGNAFIMPAAVVVDTQGIVRATWYGKHIGEIPSVPAMKLMADNVPHGGVA